MEFNNDKEVNNISEIKETIIKVKNIKSEGCIKYNKKENESVNEIKNSESENKIRKLRNKIISKN